MIYDDISTYTLPEANVACENRLSQKEIHLPTIHFQVLLLLVSGRVSEQKMFEKSLARVPKLSSDETIGFFQTPPYNGFLDL